MKIYVVEQKHTDQLWYEMFYKTVDSILCDNCNFVDVIQNSMGIVESNAQSFKHQLRSVYLLRQLMAFLASKCLERKKSSCSRVEDCNKSADSL